MRKIPEPDLINLRSCIWSQNKTLLAIPVRIQIQNNFLGFASIMPVIIQVVPVSYTLGMHRILFLPDIRLIQKPDTGYPARYLA
jgi:hypothetical protein